jgi:hypothetical protein
MARVCRFLVDGVEAVNIATGSILFDGVPLPEVEEVE